MAQCVTSLSNPLSIIEEIFEQVGKYRYLIEHDTDMSMLNKCHSRNGYFIETFLNSLQFEVREEGDFEDLEYVNAPFFLKGTEKTLDIEKTLNQVTNFAGRYSQRQTNEFLKDIKKTKDNSAYLIDAEFWCTQEQTESLVRPWDHVFVVFKLFDETGQPKYFIFDGINIYVKDKRTPWLQKTNIVELTTLFDTKCDNTGDDFNKIGQKIFQMPEMCNQHGNKCKRAKCLTAAKVRQFTFRQKIFGIQVDKTITKFILSDDPSHNVVDGAFFTREKEEIDLVIIENQADTTIQFKLFILDHDGQVLSEDEDGNFRVTGQVLKVDHWGYGICTATEEIEQADFIEQSAKTGELTVPLPKNKDWVVCVSSDGINYNEKYIGEIIFYGHAIAESIPSIRIQIGDRESTFFVKYETFISDIALISEETRAIELRINNELKDWSFQVSLFEFSDDEIVVGKGGDCKSKKSIKPSRILDVSADSKLETMTFPIHFQKTTRWVMCAFGNQFLPDGYAVAASFGIRIQIDDKVSTFFGREFHPDIALIRVDRQEIDLKIDNKSEFPIEVRLFVLSDDEIVIDGDGICRKEKTIKPSQTFTIYKTQSKKILPIILPQRKRWVICVNSKDNSQKFISYGYAIARTAKSESL